MDCILAKFDYRLARFDCILAKFDYRLAMFDCTLAKLTIYWNIRQSDSTIKWEVTAINLLMKLAYNFDVCQGFMYNHIAGIGHGESFVIPKRRPKRLESVYFRLFWKACIFSSEFWNGYMYTGI